MRYANTRVDDRRGLALGGIVLLTDVWHPWWCATIDGNDTEIFRADAIFRAVQVPPGKHTVHFRFQPLRGAWQELRAKMK